MPDDIDALMKLGNALFRQGDFDGAVLRFQQVLRSQPDNAAAHYNIGLAFHHQGKFSEAATVYEQALQSQPDLVIARNNLGVALKALGKIDEAIVCYREVLRLQPDYLESHTNLANALASQGQIEEAVKSYRYVLSVKPDCPQTHYNLGFALSKNGRAEEAIASFQKTLQLKPDHVDALFNLGIIEHEQGRLDRGLARYEQALRFDPNHSGANLNRALLWLAKGDWERGWPAFEWRWKTSDMPGYRFSRPRWDGSDFRDKTILLHAEQGLGDTLHFIRYVPLVKARGGKVILECQPPLLRLLADFPGIDRLIARGTPIPAFDVYAPLLSLPAIFHTTLATVPADVPYLHADPKLVDLWRQELNDKKAKFLVGIAWQGNPGRPDDAHRSIPLSYFARLSQVGGVRLISLQKKESRVGGRGSENSHLDLLDFGERLDASGPFLDTAAIMKNLDLVIAADTAVPHLAGALAVPVWLALNLIPDWRWLLERDDSPWYPTMRLFRQTHYAQWDDVFERMAQELKRLVQTKHG